MQLKSMRNVPTKNMFPNRSSQALNLTIAYYNRTEKNSWEEIE